ncbi:hypothetical protein OROGR_005406 [Orobanche gracilis]
MNRDNVPWPIEGGNDDPIDNVPSPIARGKPSPVSHDLDGDPFPFFIIDNVPSPIASGKAGASSEEKISGDNTRQGYATMDDLKVFIAEASAATSDIGGRPKRFDDDLDVFFASSVTTNNNSLRVKGISPEQFVDMWSEKTGIQHITYDQVWDHLDRINACSLSLVLDQTISPGDQYLKLINEAMDKSYLQMINEAMNKSNDIMCNEEGTSDIWPYPHLKDKYHYTSK